MQEELHALTTSSSSSSSRHSCCTSSAWWTSCCAASSPPSSPRWSGSSTPPAPRWESHLRNSLSKKYFCMANFLGGTHEASVASYVGGRIHWVLSQLCELNHGRTNPGIKFKLLILQFYKKIQNLVWLASTSGYTASSSKNLTETYNGIKKVLISKLAKKMFNQSCKF